MYDLKNGRNIFDEETGKRVEFLEQKCGKRYIVVDYSNKIDRQTSWKFVKPINNNTCVVDEVIEYE